MLFWCEQPLGLKEDVIQVKGQGHCFKLQMEPNCFCVSFLGSHDRHACKLHHHLLTLLILAFGVRFVFVSKSYIQIFLPLRINFDQSLAAGLIICTSCVLMGPE